jgi:hypothetical protein
MAFAALYPSYNFCVTGTRHSPRLYQGGKDVHNSGALRREGANAYLDDDDVIARSEATKQSILPLCGTMDCFASLAMTAYTTAP